ncbi:helix-turn-helix domain-containing protein [Rhizobium mayense]|uniref:Helix-turn-helix domain-containing protein n=1 Tax=Rhizobium mayense TaxID=1312184 RepID=A0ABT7K1S2_9HYPH|nr:helix-turn-helix domain-containing protein [Rhizobium mayense]MDL2402553.1 helix-turn-helix domain-containing protein [Rhizobium mayense]
MRKRTQHAERIYSVVEGNGSSPHAEEFEASWKRSILKYGLDPAAEAIPRVLAPTELKEVLERSEELVRSARDEIDRLYGTTRVAGYAALLADPNGVSVDLRGEVMPTLHLRDLGSCVGGVWSEEIHGTSGIGTCLAEERPITVHRAHHFRTQHTHLSCSGAPLFGIDGRLMAVLNISSVDPSLSERAHALTGVLTTAAARAIEERFFREKFHREWVVTIKSSSGEPGMLVAVDCDHRIQGADRAARVSLALDDQKITNGVSLWNIFRRNEDLFRARPGNDFLAQLVTVGSEDIRFALITPPCSSRAGLVLHVRPRLDMLNAMTVPEPVAPVRGGLSPSALRRVHAYVEEHLIERIQLADLSAVAGLSVYHFAREFKRTVGASPHSYITQRRVETAQEMLARTDLPLSDIALATGFFDQSHLARHFRKFTGVTPAEYRWSQC